jgi:hypothetical protein
LRTVQTERGTKVLRACANRVHIRTSHKSQEVTAQVEFALGGVYTHLLRSQERDVGQLDDIP